MKVMVTVDGSECADLAIDAIVGRVWHDNDEFLVLSVMEPLPMEFSFLRNGESENASENNLHNQFEYITDYAAKRIREAIPGHDVSTEVAKGPVASTIVDTASQWGADLIVMASHGRSGFQRILLGSVTHEVIKLAHCSVEVIKKPAQSFLDCIR